MREIKRYERGAETGVAASTDIIRLVGYDVNLASSEVLYAKESFTDAEFKKAFNIKSGVWSVKDGWIIGENSKMCPGMIVSEEDFFGDVILEATVKNIAPSTHDINIMITGEWDDEKGRGCAYVSGLEAFWHGNIGFEKSPDYKLTVATQLFDYDPDLEHVFRFGYIDSKKIFVTVDGRLCLEITDPEPLDNKKYGKIGFEAFASKFMLKNVRVLKPDYKRENEYYNPEF